VLMWRRPCRGVLKEVVLKEWVVSTWKGHDQVQGEGLGYEMESTNMRVQ
jgi:hypothetical protein